MPRPERIEFEHAHYHVMNRGRGRRKVFHGDAYYQIFLGTLSDACERFGGIVHAYCLMTNHYHLLIETPRANISRIMRHVNGVYTQKHNQLKNTDGPLFRGRFKSIVVDADAYLLQLGRYIHRNPIDTKSPLVDKLEDYRWSSYPAYINKAPVPDMLETERTYQMLGKRQKYTAYAAFVHQGVDEELARYYNRGNTATVIGDSNFRSWLHEEVLPERELQEQARITHQDVSMSRVTRAVAKHYKQKPKQLREVVKGPNKGNEARKVAMYLSHEIANATLRQIAEHFGLTHHGSVSFNNHNIRRRLKDEPKLRKQVDEIIKIL